MGILSLQAEGAMNLAERRALQLVARNREPRLERRKNRYAPCDEEFALE